MLLGLLFFCIAANVCFSYASNVLSTSNDNGVNLRPLES